MTGISWSKKLEMRRHDKDHSVLAYSNIIYPAQVLPQASTSPQCTNRGPQHAQSLRIELFLTWPLILATYSRPAVPLSLKALEQSCRPFFPHLLIP